jgi:integrase
MVPDRRLFVLSPKQVTTKIKASAGQMNAKGRPKVIKHPAGHGLYLIARDGKGWWSYQFREGAKVKSKGLGSAAAVTPTQANKARETFSVIRRNPDAVIPGVVLSTPAGLPFATVRDQFLAHNASLWSAKQRTTYANLLKTYAAPLDPIPVGKITVAQVAGCLRPIWTGPGHNRGSRLRSLIERAINGHAPNNPARWELLKISTHELQIKRTESKSHDAMPSGELPAFFGRLDMGNAEHRALAFIVLTGVRRSEALGACWREIDVNGKMWFIPGARMKEGKDHFVPLSDAAITVLGEAGKPDDLVFPSRRGRQLGHDAVSLKKLFGLEYVLHGFRTTLASWAEEAGYRTNVIQQALAHRKKGENGHALGSQDTAYMRATLYPARKLLMDEWAAFVVGTKGLRA